LTVRLMWRAHDFKATHIYFVSDKLGAEDQWGWVEPVTLYSAV